MSRTPWRIAGGVRAIGGRISCWRAKVLDTGVTLPLVDRGHSVETAWPIRYGATIVGALWCHWSMGVPLIAQDVTSVLGLAATAAAPAVHDVVERHRTPQLAGAAACPISSARAA